MPGIGANKGRIEMALQVSVQDMESNFKIIELLNQSAIPAWNCARCRVLCDNSRTLIFFYGKICILFRPYPVWHNNIFTEIGMLGFSIMSLG